jgi:hypothetical protein
MPEAPEIRIMSDFINQNSKNHKFVNFYHVQKGNQPVDGQFFDYSVESDFYGKQLQLSFVNSQDTMNISVFMGMNGNWKLVSTESWSDTKFTRMRLDREDGMSLLLYGGYMGPKYKIGGFDTKRGFDIIKDLPKYIIKQKGEYYDLLMSLYNCENIETSAQDTLTTTRYS